MSRSSWLEACVQRKRDFRSCSARCACLGTRDEHDFADDDELRRGHLPGVPPLPCMLHVHVEHTDTDRKRLMPRCASCPAAMSRPAVEKHERPKSTKLTVPRLKTDINHLAIGAECCRVPRYDHFCRNKSSDQFVRPYYTDQLIRQVQIGLNVDRCRL